MRKKMVSLPAILDRSRCTRNVLDSIKTRPVSAKVVLKIAANGGVPFDTPAILKILDDDR